MKITGDVGAVNNALTQTQPTALKQEVSMSLLDQNLDLQKAQLAELLKPLTGRGMNIDTYA